MSFVNDVYWIQINSKKKTFRDRIYHHPSPLHTRYCIQCVHSSHFFPKKKQKTFIYKKILSLLFLLSLFTLLEFQFHHHQFVIEYLLDFHHLHCNQWRNKYPTFLLRFLPMSLPLTFLS